MNVFRRQFLHMAAGTAILPAISRIANAQSYPSHAVRLIVGFGAGGTFDIAARLLGQWLTEQLGQPFIIENRPGAGANVATAAVVRAPADGYTLLLAGAVNAINATLYEHLNFDFIRDLAAVAGVIRFPNLMQVNPSFPARTVPEFITYAKANPGKINMASGGIGTTQHLSGELLKMMAEINMTHVPYRSGAQALTDLLGGRVEVAFEGIPVSIEHIRPGTLRAIAVTTAVRSDALPDVPTIGETVAGYEASGWNGICVPKNTPSGIIDILNRHINTGLADPKVKERFAELGGMPLPGTPADFAKLIVDETEKWRSVIRAATIKI